MSTEDSKTNYGDVMNGTSNEPRPYDNIVFKESVGYDDIVFTKVGGGKIRGKLLWSFMALIAFTLVVIALTVIAWMYTQSTIHELVGGQGKIGRLSLQTAKTLEGMQRYEKDFLLNYEKIGIQQAKEQYLAPFIKYSEETHRTLSQIKQSATGAMNVEAVQSAMDFIKEYRSAYVGTVDILEQRVAQEQGELVQLKKSVDVLSTSVLALNSLPINNALHLLQTSLQDYLTRPTKENRARVDEQKTALQSLMDVPQIIPATRDRLKDQLATFDKWFGEAAHTDGIIAARISSYQEAVQSAEAIIRSFFDDATANEAATRVALENTLALLIKIAVAVGFISIVLGLFLANRLSRGLTNQVNHITDVLDEIGMGNFEARAEVVRNGELGVIATSLNEMLDTVTGQIQSQEERDRIQDSIMKLLEDISALSDGDFTARAEVTEDMTGAIADSFNAMADQFTDIISKVKLATESVDTTSAQVARQTMGLAEKNIQQVNGVTVAVEAIEEMVKSIREVANNALQSASVSRTSRLNAQEGTLAVNETSTAMAEIREQINETARSIKRLGESSLEIGNIVQIIDDIADRTSILALNASIQAAMAGDAGHGFAVVADEVQRLADSSSNSTKQIELLVKSIQMEIKDVTNRIDESIGKVVQGTKFVDGAHNKLQEIEQVSNQLAELIEAITAATKSQVEMSEKISKTMEDVGEVSRESSVSSQDTATSMNLLIKTARDLRLAVDVFQVESIQPA